MAISEFLDEKYQIFDNALLLENPEINENEYGLEISIQKLKNDIFIFKNALFNDCDERNAQNSKTFGIF